MFGYAIYFYLDYLILNLKFSKIKGEREKKHAGVPDKRDARHLYVGGPSTCEHMVG